MNDLISVIITTYKRPKLLKNAIDSVINQTYKNIEIMVIDDNGDSSPFRNETIEIMKDYPDIKYIKNEKNMGASYTRNLGIKKSKGKFISFLDDDDEFAPNKLELQIKKYYDINDPNTAMIYSYLQVKNGKYIIHHDYEGNCLYEHIINSIRSITGLFPRKVLVKIGGFPLIDSQIDALLLLNILKQGYNIYLVKEVLYYYGIHDIKDGITGISDRYFNNIIEYRTECRKLYSRFSHKKIDNIECRFNNQICNYYIRKQDKKNAMKYLVMMIKKKIISKSILYNFYKILFNKKYER